VNGIDLNRVHLLVAVLEKRARLPLGKQDIFVNVAGGVRLAEPAADLAVALAIASNCRDRPVGRDVVALGELGLSGEVRRVPQLERRLHEAHRLGFKRAIVPAAGELKNLPAAEGNGQIFPPPQGEPPLSGSRDFPRGQGRGGGALTVHRVETLAEAMALCFTGD
jgi:predicted ATP-dependent serine protease